MTRFLLRRITQGVVRDVPGDAAASTCCSSWATRTTSPNGCAAGSARRTRCRPSTSSSASTGRSASQYGHFLWRHAARRPRRQLRQRRAGHHGAQAGRTRSPSRWASAPRSIWLVLGVSTGVYSSIHARSVADRVFTALALFFYSIPVFVLGLHADLPLLLPAHHPRPRLVPGVGLRRPDRRPVPVGPPPDPALDHPRADLRRGLHPAQPYLDARGAGRGLHPHRPGQGAVRAAGRSSGTRCARR